MYVTARNKLSQVRPEDSEDWALAVIRPEATKSEIPKSNITASIVGRVPYR